MKTRLEIEQQIIKKAAEDETFLKQLKENPKKAIAVFLPDDVEIPEGVSVKVMQETPTELILRLPFTLSDKEELSEEELDAVAGGGYNSAIEDGVNSSLGVMKFLATMEVDPNDRGCTL